MPRDPFGVYYQQLGSHSWKWALEDNANHVLTVAKAMGVSVYLVCGGAYVSMRDKGILLVWSVSRASA